MGHDVRFGSALDAGRLRDGGGLHRGDEDDPTLGRGGARLRDGGAGAALRGHLEGQPPAPVPVPVPVPNRLRLIGLHARSAVSCGCPVLPDAGRQHAPRGRDDANPKPASPLPLADTVPSGRVCPHGWRRLRSAPTPMPRSRAGAVNPLDPPRHRMRCHAAAHAVSGRPVGPTSRRAIGERADRWEPIRQARPACPARCAPSRTRGRHDVRPGPAEPDWPGRALAASSGQPTRSWRPGADRDGTRAGPGDFGSVVPWAFIYPCRPS